MQKLASKSELPFCISKQYQCNNEFLDVMISFAEVFSSNSSIHSSFSCKSQCKAIPLQAWTGPEGSSKLRLPEFLDSQHMKVVRLSALRTGRLYPQGNISGTHFCQRLSRPQGYNAAGRIMSMKNSIDTIGNRTPHLPACSAVPQPTAPPCAPIDIYIYKEQQ